jgi:heme oxygenase (biliverdin-IX-beta and delta-forming)
LFALLADVYVASWVLTQLNLETRIHHAEVDADQLAVLDQPTPTAYRDFLARTYGFEASVESALAMCPAIDRLVDLRPRAKAGLLAADLLALGLRPHELAELPLCSWLDACDNVSDAMGWLYVVERKTLLHNAILRHLTVRMPAVMPDASAYLRCYEGVAGARWRDLGAAFDRAATPATANKIVAAAHQAFWSQRDWFRRERKDTRRATG